jgi:hypothetical protein
MPETHLGGCMCGSVWYQVTVPTIGLPVT